MGPRDFRGSRISITEELPACQPRAVAGRVDFKAQLISVTGRVVVST